MEELTAIKTADGREFKPWATNDDLQAAVQDPASVTAIASEIASGKQAIASAINAKGGTASATESFAELADAILNLANVTIVSTAGLTGVGVPINLLKWLLNGMSSSDSNFSEISDNTVTTISVSRTLSYIPTLKRVVLNAVESISASYVFNSCTLLQRVELPNLQIITGDSLFCRCPNLHILDLPSLEVINSRAFWQDNEGDGNYEEFLFPKLHTLLGTYCFLRNKSLKNVVFGTLTDFGSASFAGSDYPNIRNITIGIGTDVNLYLVSWSATNVIAEGQSGIDELNSNLYNNLLTKLYDHSNDGQTRTLRIGWLARVTAENIAYANAKGWTLTT